MMKINIYKIIILSLILSCFWDIFYYGVFGRLLDNISFLLLLTFSFYKRTFNFNKNLKDFSLLIGIPILIFLLIASRGIIFDFIDFQKAPIPFLNRIESNSNQSLLTFISLIMGSITFFLIRVQEIDLKKGVAEKLIKFLVYFQILQIIIYRLFNYYFDLSLFTGGVKSRVFNLSIQTFRPSSIFQEPNGYSVTIVSLICLLLFLSLKEVKGDFWKSIDLNKKLIIMSALSISLTFSLWGLIMGVFFVLIIIFQLILKFTKKLLFDKKINLNNFLTKKNLLFFLTFSLIIIIQSKYFTNNLSIAIFRITSLGSDPSASARYRYGENIFEILNNLDAVTFLFGNGATTARDTFQNFMGANGFSFLIFSIGFIGIFFLISVFIPYSSKIEPHSKMNYFISYRSLRHYFYFLFFMLIISTSYPLYTYQISWISSALIINSISALEKK